MFTDFNNLFNEFEKMMSSQLNGRKKTFRTNDGIVHITTFYGNDKTSSEDNISELKYELERLVESQEFEKAVELRDKIKKLEINKESIEKLNLELSESIKSQDFERCINLRDKIRSLK